MEPKLKFELSYSFFKENPSKHIQDLDYRVKLEIEVKCKKPREYAFLQKCIFSKVFAFYLNLELYSTMEGLDMFEWILLDK